MIQKLRIKFTIINMSLIGVVLIAIALMMIMSAYNDRMLIMQNRLQSAITENTGGTEFLAHPLDNELSFGNWWEASIFNGESCSGWLSQQNQNTMSNQSISTNKQNSASNQDNSKANSILPQVGGISSRSRDGYIPVAVYSIGASPSDLTNVAESTIFSALLDKISDEVFYSNAGFHKSDNVNLYYFKDMTSQGERVAFADSSYIDNYINKVIRSFVLGGIIALIILSIISYVLSGWVVKPVKETWEKQHRFIADASHELRTPVSVIMANSSILIDNEEKTVASQRQWIDSTMQETESMSELIEELLFLSANDVEKPHNNNEKVDISKILLKTTLQFESVAFEKGVKIETNIDDNLYVLGDSKGLLRVFSILLDNACKYSDKNTSINILAQRLGKKIIITVTNYGLTIEPEEINNVFDRFYRADKARTRQGGYGLGLSMSKDIIERHGGDISVKSDSENGTVFKVLLKSF